MTPWQLCLPPADLLQRGAEEERLLGLAQVNPIQAGHFGGFVAGSTAAFVHRGDLAGELLVGGDVIGLLGWRAC